MRFCALIPVYNHGDTLVATLQKLSAYGLPTILVDDGSDEYTRRIVDRLAAQYRSQRLRLPENRGKGAAVQAGLREAASLGYTHALQVDADGQHDLEDVGRLLDRARERPDALISGDPEFDATAPASRRYGRNITTFWVAVETLSLDIPDAMCGFRVYPLESCMRLLDRKRLGPRMEFDVEIAVRLYWSGVPFDAIRTKVIYPDGGTSHFRLVADNWRITRTHTRLFFGMLLRLPMLLLRKLGIRRQHWAALEERGAVAGMKFLFAAYRLFGRGFFRVMLFPVIAYFFVTSATARRASREYLDRVQRTRAKRSGESERRLSGFRHFLQFGEAVLDKAAHWAGVHTKEIARYSAPELCREVMDSERGGVFIGSHLGNLEALRAVGGLEQGLVVNALVFTRHSPRFMAFLEQANPKAVENVVQVDTLGPESAVRLADRIDAGQWVAMVADRISVAYESRSVSCEFLGDRARFPEGPFILASLLACPVYLLFCVRRRGEYEVHLEKLADRLELPRNSRRQAIEKVVRRYAERLEAECLEFPYQWYNFFDFWQWPENNG